VSILVVNAGSSSLKFGLFDAAAREQLAAGLIDWTADPKRAELVVRPRQMPEVRYPLEVNDHRAAMSHALRAISELQQVGPLTPGSSPPRGEGRITAVGHRVVHGGEEFHDSVRIDRTVTDAIRRLVPLAPLHNPAALEAIDAAANVLPNVPHVVVFDTAYFASLPPRAYVYPVPYEWYERRGVRRFGFHGISHAYCAGRAAELLGRPLADLRVITCHLGNGCSATAIEGGKARATTMGFTPMDGLMMGTRPGSLDPGLLLYLLQQQGFTADQLDEVLNRGSGLLGVSGVASDFRQVEEAAGRGHERARLALEIYADRVRGAVGALAVTLGGVDALVFTAGVGEHSAPLRAAACAGLACIGVRLDADRNASARPDADVAVADSAGRILVIQTREELMIARETRRILDDVAA
jgi:acetate kinase